MKKKISILIMMVVLSLVCISEMKIYTVNADKSQAKETIKKDKTTNKKKVTKKSKSIDILNIDKSYTITYDKKVALKAKVMPKNASQKIKWISSNTKVVSISKKGVIKGKAKGYAWISAKTTDKTNLINKVKIIVTKPVTNIDRTNLPKKKVIKLDSSYKLLARVKPIDASNTNIIWTSSDNKIATVVNGNIVGKNVGTTIITAKSADGSNIYKTCTVYVEKQVETIEIKGKELVAAGKTTKLNKTILPIDATHKNVVWITKNPSIAKVDKYGTVTGIKDGKVEILAMATDTGRVIGNISITVRSLLSTESNFVAHRGLSKEVPENTIPAFEKAAKEKFWGIECDIYESYEDGDNDGKKDIMVMHDDTIERTCGVNVLTKNINKGNREQYPIVKGHGIENYLELYIPTFEEYIDAIKSKVPVIELKDADMSKETDKEVLDILKEKGVKEVSIISFRKEQLINLEQILKDNDYSDIEIHSMLLTYGYKAEGEELQEDIDWCKEHGILGINMSVSQVTNNTVKMLNDNGLAAALYICDNYENAIGYSDMGFDYITSNYNIFTD